MRLGQSQMMEYMLLTVFIIILMVSFMIMMSVFQVGSVRSENAETIYKQSLVVTRFMTNNNYLNNPRFPDGSMMDDSKITMVNCTELKKVLGTNWFAFVRIPGEMPEDIECTIDTYPDCNLWVICDKKKFKGETCVHEVPVNVYRKMDDKIEIGILSVGLYGKCT